MDLFTTLCLFSLLKPLACIGHEVDLYRLDLSLAFMRKVLTDLRIMFLPVNLMK